VLSFNYQSTGSYLSIAILSPVPGLFLISAVFSASINLHNITVNVIDDVVVQSRITDNCIAQLEKLFWLVKTDQARIRFRDELIKVQTI
jgi:hypothetical protein